jgi:hypothetical protein
MTELSPYVMEQICYLWNPFSPDSAVQREVMEQGANLPQRRQCVSAPKAVDLQNSAGISNP